MTTKPIPLTHITFDQEMSPALMRGFRGAIIESVMQHRHVFEAAGINTEVFHNHKETVGQAAVAIAASGEALPAPAEKPGRQRYYDYPTVQYKLRHRRPGIMGVGPGAQAVQLWLSLCGDHLLVNGPHHREPYRLSLDVYRHDHQQWRPALLDKPKTYRLSRWLPMNRANHDKWKRLGRLTERAAMLDGLLWGHLCHLCEGLDITLPKDKVQLWVSQLDHQGYQDCYGIKKLSLDITFTTNVNLPPGLGLGQGTTLGFGKACPLS
ncbi:MAG: CRISPR-associated endonuclease Cas6 [Cyclobacteriaceae bacterium]